MPPHCPHRGTVPGTLVVVVGGRVLVVAVVVVRSVVEVDVIGFYIRMLVR
jgi:hypothetical protein